MNNKEWLYSLEPSELAEWFESEHSNDTFSTEKVVKSKPACSNDTKMDATSKQNSRFVVDNPGKSAENRATKSRICDFAAAREEIYAEAFDLLEKACEYGQEHVGDMYSELEKLLGRLEDVVICEWESNMSSIYSDWNGIRVFGKSLFEIREIIARNAAYEEVFTDIKRMFTTKMYHF